jgi:hypothetical protein
MARASAPRICRCKNPTKFNLTIAKALGPNAPLSLQERADSLIE